jgi:hypothetical protein
MIGYLNMGLGPEGAVQRNPLKEYTAEFGDPSAFLYGALRSMMIAYVARLQDRTNALDPRLLKFGVNMTF